MKLKKYFFALLAVLCLATLASCGGSEAQPLKVFVGTESAAYYQQILTKYATDNKLPFKIEVSGGDTGGYADIFTKDTKKGADIFVTAHDNIAKLTAGAGTIAPITDQELIDNMEATVDTVFTDVCYVSAGGAQPKYYGVPLIRQALVLYYNKAYFNDSNIASVETWDGILQVAKANGKLAVAYNGTGGYNYSHWLLAQPANDATKAKYGAKGTLQLFQEGSAAANYAWGADQLQIHEYAKKFTMDPNGRNGSVAGKSDWKLVMGEYITLVAGAWDRATVAANWGPDGYGVTVLPTFTTANGDVFRSGSFYDVKCLFKKKGSAYASYLDDIMKFLSSDAVQLESYTKCGNLPASNTVQFDENDQLARAQIRQGQLAGLPQPFGYNEEFNPSYYLKGTDKAMMNLHENKYATEEIYKGYNLDTKTVLQLMSYTWATGNIFSHELPSDTLQAWVASTGK